MPSKKYIPHYPISDYNQCEGNWELIDGVPFAMNPSPVRKYQGFSAILMHQIGKNLDAKNETYNTG